VREGERKERGREEIKYRRKDTKKWRRRAANKQSRE
jgi:hypothetical protein